MRCLIASVQLIIFISVGQKPAYSEVTDSPAGCRNPGYPAYGFMIPNNTVFPVVPGFQLRFGCCDEYDLVGESVINCTDDNFWDAAIPICNPRCKPGIELSFGGSCYFSPEPGSGSNRLTFLEAVEFCEDRGYYLASIGSKEEHEYLQGVLAADPYGRYRYWFGAVYDKTEGVWKWVSGHAWTYDGLWYANNPFSGGIHWCGLLNRRYNYEMVHDSDCNYPQYLVCERGGPVKCDDPGLPENGNRIKSVIFPATIGESLTYECDEGFVMYGEPTIVCEAKLSDDCTTGFTWNHPVPVCVLPSYCFKPDIALPLTLAYTLKFPAENGTTLALECYPSYYILEGDPAITCRDGTWSGNSSCIASTLEPTTEEFATDVPCTLVNNLALNRPSGQSSIAYGGDPENANDGDESPDYSDGSCSHTKSEKDPWWLVKVGTGYTVQEITITNRAGKYGKRLLGAEVRVGFQEEITEHELCGTVNDTSINPIKFTCDLVGSYVSVQLKGNDKILSICGFQVCGEIFPTTPPTTEMMTTEEEATTESVSPNLQTTTVQETSAGTRLRTYTHQTSGQDETTATELSLLVTSMGTKQRDSTTMQETTQERMTLEYGKTNEVNQPGESTTLKPTTGERSTTKWRRSTIGFKTTQQATTEKRKSTNQKGNTDQMRSDVMTVIILEFIAIYFCFI